jgi:hypothetical protein
MIRTISNMIYCLLFQTSIPASYWAEALHTATHLNHLPSKAVSHPTPHFALYDIAPPTTSTCSDVPAIPTIPLLLLISCLPAPPAASFLATPLTTRGIVVLTSSPTASSSLVTSSSTKMYFLLLGTPHPSISTPSLSPTRLPHYTRRSPRTVARATRSSDTSARTSTRATCGPGDRACTTRGPVDLGPVDECDSLHRSRPRLPPSRERPSLGAHEPRPLDGRDPIHRLCRRLSLLIPKDPRWSALSRRYTTRSHSPRPQTRSPDGDPTRHRCPSECRPAYSGRRYGHYSTGRLPGPLLRTHHPR